MSSLHLSEYRFIAQMTANPLNSATNPKKVQTHPLPTAPRIGAATTPPTHENMFLTKLLTAMPVEALRGMNSVSMVVAIPKMIMLPTPKKKLAMICYTNY
jgi:hypothetical protein